jgi:hypothetical protein
MYMNGPPQKNLELLVDDAIEKGGMMLTGHDARRGRFAVVQIHYKGRFGEYMLESDVYKSDTEGFTVHMYCPVCSTKDAPHNMQITSARKKIDFDSERGISIEKFRCTWELPGPPGTSVLDLKTCKFSIAVDNNVARDA